MSGETCVDCGVTMNMGNLGSLRIGRAGAVAICADCRATYPSEAHLDVRMDDAHRRLAAPAPDLDRCMRCTNGVLDSRLGGMCGDWPEACP